MESNIQKIVVGNNPFEDGELKRLQERFEVVNINKDKPETEKLKSTVDVKSVPEITHTVKEEMKMEKKHSIFISYSHEDEEWLKKVLRVLKPLQRYYDNVDIWSDKKIMASDDWKEQIDNALGDATIAILLVSPDFMASDFITNEELQPILSKAVVEGSKILTLVLRPTALLDESGILKYQAVNDPKKPLSGMTEYDQENVLVNLVETIKVIIKK